jgi:hypothetical protein
MKHAHMNFILFVLTLSNFPEVFEGLVTSANGFHFCEKIMHCW